MRSLALQRYSAAGAVIILAAFAAQTATLNIPIPVQQIKLAWTLARVLLQL
jgi:hypothetical protein